MQRRDIANILKQQHLANYLNAEMHIKNNVIAYMSVKYFFTIGLLDKDFQTTTH